MRRGQNEEGGVRKGRPRGPQRPVDRYGAAREGHQGPYTLPPNRTNAAPAAGRRNNPMRKRWAFSFAKCAKSFKGCSCPRVPLNKREIAFRD